MEAIKKKVQAMKVEKDNLCDKCDEVEQVTCDVTCDMCNVVVTESLPHYSPPRRK